MLVGLVAAAFPGGWMGLFTGDDGVLADGRLCLRIVGAAFARLGAGLGLFIAAQGTGRVLEPLVAGFTRLTVAAAGGYTATRVFGLGLPALDTAMAAGLAANAVVMVVVARRELGFVLVSRTSLGRDSTDPHDLLLDELDDRIE